MRPDKLSVRPLETPNQSKLMIVRPTVLVVDDEAVVLASLSRYLQLAGYDVRTADDVDPAFDVLRKSAIDALILDVRLPHGRSGLDVLEFIRLDERWRDLPVVILTGVRLTPEEEEFIRHYPAHVFYKPQGYGELVGQLNQMLART